jgi:hypothetical protein
MAGFEAPEASLTFTKTSAHIHGRLAAKAVEFGETTLHEPSLDILMESEAAKHGARTLATIQGNVHFNAHLIFPATTHLYMGSSGLEWTVFASLTAPKHPHLALSKVVPELEHTPFDLVLSNVVFVDAFKDDPPFGQPFNDKYSYHKGEFLIIFCMVCTKD